jgi:hypothetical protein
MIWVDLRSKQGFVVRRKESMVTAVGVLLLPRREAVVERIS